MQAEGELNIVYSLYFTFSYGQTHTAVIEKKPVRLVHMQISPLCVCVLMGARVDN